MSTRTFGKPVMCSECPTSMIQPSRGRPRKCCSPECVKKRDSRIKAETRAMVSEIKAADLANKMYLDSEREFFKPVGRASTICSMVVGGEA